MKVSTLIILFIGAVIVLGILLGFIFVNRGSEKVVSLFMKSIAGPLIVALVLLGYEILSPVPPDRNEVFITLIHDHNFNIAPFHKPLLLNNSLMGNGFVMLDQVVSGWQAAINKSKPILQGQDDFYIDLTELSLIYWLHMSYPMHWQIERDEFRGINMSGGSYHAIEGAERNPRSCSENELKELLRENRLVKDGINPFFYGKVFLPSNSEVSINRRKGLRIIQIKNRRMNLTIRIAQVGSGGGEGTNLGKRLAKAFPGYTEHEYLKVIFECNYTPYLKWSPRTIHQKKWVNEMAALFNRDFEWDGIRSELEKYLS